MLLTSQNHSTDRIYHFHGPKKRAPPELGQKSKITKNCVGVYQNFLSPTFLDVKMDVESDKKNRLKFWPSGAEIWPFFWFWSSQIAPYSVIFSKKSKNFFFKCPWNMAYFVPNFLLIIFLKTKKIYLVPPTQKNSKNCRKFAKNRPCLGLKFLETGTEIEKSAPLV